MLVASLVLRVLELISSGTNLVSRSMSTMRKIGKLMVKRRRVLRRNPRSKSLVAKRMLRKPRNVSWLRLTVLCVFQYRSTLKKKLTFYSH